MPAIDTLLVDRSPGETRVAALADETVVEVHYRRSGQPQVGDVYQGRVSKPLPDATAVFVDIGLDQAAFMNCGAKPPAEGSALAVRIIQSPRGEKGAKVAATDTNEKKSASSLGLITPAPHPVSWCVQHYSQTLTRVIVSPNDADQTVAPLLNSSIALESWIQSAQSDDLFDHYGVHEAIELALEPVVPLNGGGRLIIESTAAFTAVDIDAGSMPVEQANAAAMDALAEALRLRAIGGPIIVDLIPARSPKKFVEQLRTAVLQDPVPTRLSGLTPDGRIELTRRRLRPSLADLLLNATLGPDLSPDAVAYEALRNCVREGLSAGAARLSLTAHKDVVALLQTRLRPALDETESLLKMEVTLNAATDVPLTHIDVQT